MADTPTATHAQNDTLTVTFADEYATTIRAAAARSGVSPDDWVVNGLATALEDFQNQAASEERLAEMAEVRRFFKEAGRGKHTKGLHPFVVLSRFACTTGSPVWKGFAENVYVAAEIAHRALRKPPYGRNFGPLDPIDEILISPQACYVVREPHGRETLVASLAEDIERDGAAQQKVGSLVSMHQARQQQ